MAKGNPSALSALTGSCAGSGRVWLVRQVRFGGALLWIELLSLQMGRLETVYSCQTCDFPASAC